MARESIVHIAAGLPKASGEHEKKMEKVTEKNDSGVQDVVDDVLERAKKYGFQPDEDMVRGTVEESANLLNIELSDEQIAQACERIMQPQETERVQQCEQPQG